MKSFKPQTSSLRETSNPKHENPLRSNGLPWTLKFGAWIFSEAWRLELEASPAIGAWSFPEAWRLKFEVYLVLLCLALSPAAVPAQPILLSNAIIHTVSGETLAPGQVLIKDGKIAAVGTTVPAPGAETLDLKGQHLYPGLIALNTV